MDKLNKEELDILKKITNIEKIESCAYNIRKDGKLFSKKITKNISITAKDKSEGIDIHIKKSDKKENVFIPVIVSQGGINDLVYNDFYIEQGAEVNIYAGCGIHNCSNKTSEHSGIHRFYLGKNSNVKYIENHYGKGDGTKILNPVTEVYLEEGSILEMHTNQIEGVSSSIRKTSGVLKEKSTLIVRENIKTHLDQEVKTYFDIVMEEKDSSCHLISRGVATENSRQEFYSKLVGNAKSYAHSECDAILEGNGIAIANPIVIANSPDSILVHEAKIGKIASDQLNKLMTLGLTTKEAENVIIKGFLK